jgi:hypothetical protein
MVYETGRLKDQVHSLNEARTMGFKLIIGMAGVGMLLSEIQRLRASLYNSMTLAYLALFVIVGILLWLWSWATKKDLELLTEWLDPKEYAAPSGLRETLTIMALAVVAVTLLFSTRDPLVFGFVFIIFCLLAHFAEQEVYREVCVAIQKSKMRLEEDMSVERLQHRSGLFNEGLRVLELYFLGRPHNARHWFVLSFAVLGFSSAIVAGITGNKAYGISAYVVYYVVIIVPEVIIYYWRNKRDNSLRIIKAKLSEIDRSASNENR